LARTVLLADDSVTAQNMGRRILVDAGYEVITVNNGSAALKKIHESRPDLIVLDVYMPGYGGLEVCQRLKESDDTMRIPVLLTVGKMEPFKTDEAKRVRADGHIIKPFDASELLAALTRLEDRIVPQSENGRGRRAKPEVKKARFWQSKDPATTFDDSQTEQIAYLAEVKKRKAAASQDEDEAPAEALAPTESLAPSTTDAPGEVNSVAPPAEMAPAMNAIVPEQEIAEPVQEPVEEAYTFASAPGLVSEPEASAPNEDEGPTPEFQVEKDIQADAESEVQSETTGGIESYPETASSETPPVSASSAAELEPERGSAPRWIAENVALTPEEASASLADEMHQAEVSEPAESESNPGHDTEKEEAVSPYSVTTEEPGSAAPADLVTDSGAAFAAAASATSETASPTNAVGTAPSDPEPQPGAEAAAAWENWQRIRDSVMSRESAAAIAVSAAEVVHANIPPQDSVSSPAAMDDPASQPAMGADALASIVDSVLAELKPKLMQEIAKKLAAEKK
jgi:CheY-like chemotaxis protein